MKIKTIILPVFIAAIALCGCSQTGNSYNVNNESANYDTAIITNPFEDDIDESETDVEIISDFGWGIDILDFEYLQYDSNGLTVPIKVINKGSEFNIGFYIYADGIEQSYSLEQGGEYKYMQSINIPENEEKSFKLFIDKLSLSEKLSESELAIGAIINPEYIPTPKENMGLNHSGTGICPVSLKIDSDVSIEEYKIFSEFDSHTINDNEKQQFWIDTNSEYSTVQVFLCPEDSDSNPNWMLPVTDDGVQDLELYMYSVNYGITDFRISIYKNNERIKFNDGCDYADITVKDGYMNTSRIKLTDILEGDFVYCVAVPLNSDNAVKKITDVVFFNSSDIPPLTNGGFSPAVPDLEKYEMEMSDISYPEDRWIANTSTDITGGK